MKNNMKLFIFISVLFSSIRIGKSQCAAGTSFGEQSPNSKSGQQDGNTNTGYILLGNTNGYTISCCGVASGWEIESSAAGTVYLQIWRPSGSGYELVGENAENIANAGTQPISIAAGNRISVRTNDRIGWYASGTNIVEHKNVAGADNTYWTGMTKPSQGDVVTWSGASVTSVSSITYAIRVDVDGGSPPAFSNPASGTAYPIQNNVAVGLLLETITWSDPDIGDTLTVTMDTSTTQFNFDTLTGDLTVASSLSGPTTTVTLDFTVEDFCGNTDSLSIDIVITNDPPEIHNLPASYFLSEDSSVQTSLFTINATDTADDVECMFDSLPAGYPFVVLRNPTTNYYEIYVEANPGFDYDVQSTYNLDIVCTDQYANSDIKRFSVYLQENQPPVVHNLQAAVTLSTTETIGYSVFTVNATDAEGDTLTFTMTPVTAPAPFDIYAGGQIQLNADISSYTTTGYDLEIYVSDGRATVGPKILTVIIQDINDPVLISNLPLASSLSVPENTPLSTSVFTVSYSDQDTQTWTFTESYTPGTGSSYFSLDSSGLISTSGTILNYETLAAAGSTTFTLTISVSDGTASDTDPLVIDITNVNEAPAFPQSSYSLSKEESPAGTVIGTPSFAVTDPDIGDSFSYSINCGSYTHYFLMDTSTGEVSFQSDYYIDAGLPANVTCTVTVEDTGSLTDTATLYIYISDTNDNTPVFSPASYTFFISYYTSVGTIIGTITATDGDAGSFGTLTYTLDQSSLLDEYFDIDNNGQIGVKKTPNGNAIGYATPVTVTANAYDGGGLSDSAIVTIVISDTTTTSTTTTTDRFKTFIEDNRNVAWLVACLVLLVITAIYLTWLICTCSGVNGCQTFRRHFCLKKKTWRPRQRRPPPSPLTPPPVPRKMQDFVVVRPHPPPKGEQAWRLTAGAV